MNGKFSFLAPIIFIIICSIFIASTSKSSKPLSGLFNVSLLTPTPYKTFATPTAVPSSLTPTRIPSPTPTINPKLYLSAAKVYTPAQIQYFKTHDIYKYIANVKFPPLPKVKSTDSQIPVYIINVQVDNSLVGFKAIPVIEYIPRDNSPILKTLDLMAAKGYGGFPLGEEITRDQSNSGLQYKHKISGVNQVVLNSDGTLRINFYDSVAAYGGGSARVAAMGYTTAFTAMQYPEVTSILRCIDKLPTTLDSCPADFQP